MRPSQAQGLRPVRVGKRHAKRSIATGKKRCRFEVFERVKCAELVIVGNLLVKFYAEAVLIERSDVGLGECIVERYWILNRCADSQRGRQNATRGIRVLAKAVGI